MSTEKREHKIALTRVEFERAIIAQDDDNDYQESGYVAFVIGKTAYLARYGHCSCYGTFEDLCGGGISDHLESGEATCCWSGPIRSLVAMAKRRADPDMPERTMSSEDYDHDHLIAVYEQIIAWDKKGRIK